MALLPWMNRASRCSSPSRVTALRAVGVLALAQGDVARAQAVGEEAVALARRTPDTGQFASALNTLGLVVRMHGSRERAAALHTEALAVARGQGETVTVTVTVAEALQSLGTTTAMAGDLLRAEPLLEESVALWRALGDRRKAAEALNELVMLANLRGAYARRDAGAGERGDLPGVR